MGMRKLYFLLSVVLSLVFLSSFSVDAARREKKAKYVFYFIGDGMGINQVNGTEMFLAEKEGRIGVEALNFTTFPVRNFVTTYSAFNSVTCSAAAGTALATGEKTKNGTVAMNRECTAPLYSVAVKAKEMGMKVGIATNNSIDHATPACFYAHQPDRNMFYEIATDLPKAGFDFYAGSGFLNPEKKDSVSIYTLFDQAGYTVARGTEDFLKKWEKADRIIFTQKDGADKNSLPYAIDRQIGDLSLEEITQGAIDFLSKDADNGFLMMIECGMIDWACHNNDAAAMFCEVIDFQKSIQKAIDFYHQHPHETLIVVTADHETGGFVLGTGRYELNLKALQNQKLSKDSLLKKIAALKASHNYAVTWEEVKKLLGDNLGLWTRLPVRKTYEEELRACYEKAFGMNEQEITASSQAAYQALVNTAVSVLNRMARIGWTSGGHSAGYVPLFVLGVGAENFEGKLDNTDIPKQIERLMNGVRE